MSSKFVVAAAFASLLSAQTAPSLFKVLLPPDSPLTLAGADWGDSRTSERGSAMILDLQTSLSLRNATQRRIRGLKLMVQSQEVTPGGRASVTKVSLDVAPGETFPVRVELRLLRPITRGTGPLVEMSLDGVLFDDLVFYGPNKLDSRRELTAYELEAQRDRRYFLSILQSQGPDGLKNAMLVSQARQSDTLRLGVQLARGRTTNVESQRRIEFSFLRFPDSPVEPVAGMAYVAGAEAQAPKLEVVNRSQRAVQYLELGWILKDRQGREFLAGAVPSRTTLAPGQKTEVLGQNALQFSDRGGAPVAIDGMTGFVSQVEFTDGSVWVPSRLNLDEPRLQRAIAVSPEEERLTSIYRKRGLQAVVDELKRLTVAAR